MISIYYFSKLYCFTKFQKGGTADGHLLTHVSHNQETAHDLQTLTGIKDNEAADKRTKEATDMPGMTKTRLSYTYYYPASRRARSSDGIPNFKKNFSFIENSLGMGSLVILSFLRELKVTP